MKIFVYILLMILLSGFSFAEDKKDRKELSPEETILFVKKTGRENPKVGKAIIKGLINDLEKNAIENKELLSESYYVLGRQDVLLKNYSESIKWFSKTISLNNHNRALIHRGRIYFGESRFNDALLDWEKATIINPDDKILIAFKKQMEDFLKANPDAKDLSDSLKEKKEEAKK